LWSLDLGNILDGVACVGQCYNAHGGHVVGDFARHHSHPADFASPIRAVMNTAARVSKANILPDTSHQSGLRFLATSPPPCERRPPI
jgi:hypothetical protein